MINMFSLWQSIMSEVNVQQGGNIRPQVDYTNWVNSISLEIFKEYVGKYGISQVLDDAISPFLKSVNVSVRPMPNLPYDLVPYPTDYSDFASMKIYHNNSECGMVEGKDIVCEGRCIGLQDDDYAQMAQQYMANNLVTSVVWKIDNQRFDNSLTHLTKRPSYNNPYITQYDGGFKIAPKGISVVELDYFVLPQKAIFVYTIDEDNQIVYDANASQNLNWPEFMFNEFLARLKKKYSVYIGDGGLYQIAENDKKTLS